MRNLNVIGITTLLLIASCATPPPTISQQDISAAEQSGGLETLYEQMAASLEGKSAKDAKHQAAFVKLNKVGNKIAISRSDTIKKNIENARQESGLVPRQVLTQAKSDMAAISRWDKNIHSELNTAMNKESKKIDTVVNKQLKALKGLKKDQFKKRLNILKDLAFLTDDKQYQNQYDELVITLKKQATEAQQSEDLETAKKILEALPKNETAIQELVKIDTKLFEKRFNKALANDKPDEAFKHFEKLAQSSNFGLIKKSLVDTGEVMANYFIALAATATESGELSDSHRWFNQARFIKKHLNIGKLETGEEAPFIEKMAAGYKAAQKEKLPGISLGYAYVIRNFKPNYPSLRRMIRETEEKVLQEATKKVSTTAFKNAAGKHEYGNTISSRITQYLFENIPNDVRIIERDQYEAIKREQELKGGSSTLTSVDYLITGSVLESKVDTAEQKGRKTMRAVTEKGSEPNPEYATWMQLSDDSRKKIDQPAKTRPFEKKEDITVNVTVHRKIGIFSVSYRLIDATSGKVVFPDSITVKEEFSDESTEGIELGDFKMEFKLADLPSDIEMLDKLANTISAEIGKKLADKLKNPDIRYETAARQHINEGNYTDATIQFAYATSMATQKGKDTKELKKELEAAAIASGFSNN